AYRSAELHKSLLIADLHADSLLWGRDLLQRSSRGHVDVPRLISGNVALQVFSIVTKVPRNLNIERNSADSDQITQLAVGEAWPAQHLVQPEGPGAIPGGAPAHHGGAVSRPVGGDQKPPGS